MLESIVPTNNSDLFVVPFTIPGMDLDNFGYGGYSNRTHENKELDFSKGNISKTLKILIPSKFTDFIARIIFPVVRNVIEEGGVFIKSTIKKSSAIWWGVGLLAVLLLLSKKRI